MVHYLVMGGIGPLPLLTGALVLLLVLCLPVVRDGRDEVGSLPTKIEQNSLRIEHLVQLYLGSLNLLCLRD